MKKYILYSLAALTTTSCLTIQSRIDRAVHGDNPYAEAPFYARYLNTNSDLDRQIQGKLAALRANPDSPALHNDLGALLLEKGFPKDAEVEFRRAVAGDPQLYAAWYNLGLIREARGDDSGAAAAFEETLQHKPGHPMAHFQLGLLKEKRGKTDAAIEHYSRAFEINDRLLDVRINPRILDTELVDRALLAKYERTHARKSASFQATPSGYLSPSERRAHASEAGRTDEPDMPAASPEAPPTNIISPAPSAQDLAKTQSGGTTPPAEVPTPRRVVRPTDPGPETQRPARDDDGEGGPGFSVLPNASADAHAP